MQTATHRTIEDARQRLGCSVRLADVTAVVALERVKHAFAQEGFSVLAEIDLRDSLQRRTDRDVDAYWVIELYHPVLAARALRGDRAAALTTLFKVGVWQDGKGAGVAAVEFPGEAEAHVVRALGHLTE